MTARQALRESSRARDETTRRRIADALAELDHEQQKTPRVERQYPLKRVLEIVNRDAAKGQRIHRSTISRNQKARALIAKYQCQGKTQTLESQLNLPATASWKPPRGESDRMIAERRRHYLKLSVCELARRVVCLQELGRYFLNRRTKFEVMLAAGPEWPSTCTYPSAPFRPSPDEIRLACDRWQSYINKLRKDDLITMLTDLEHDLAEDMAHLLTLDLQYGQQNAN